MAGERIKMEMNMREAILALVESNPGALTAVCEMVKIAEQVDPDALMGGFSIILDFDSYGIYAEKIYILWSDICGKDAVKTIAMLRACQLGFISSSDLREAIDREFQHGLDVDSYVAQVKERLPKFDAGGSHE